MKKGFTLIELLAVIVVLAIILVIAIPNVMKIIEQARIDAYKRNEELLINLTIKYLSQKGITLQQDESMVITYQNLKDANVLDTLPDINNNNECINSRVYVTNTINGYSYEAGLVCDGYISINAFDLLNGIGDFENDSNSDGLADGLYKSSNGACTVTDNKQRITGLVGDTSYDRYVRVNNRLAPQNKYYFGFNVDLSNAAAFTNTTIFRLYCGDEHAFFYDIGSSIRDNYISMVVQFITAECSPFNIISLDNHSAVGGTNWIQFYNVKIFNLTDIYGVGNEPTKQVFDQLINKSRK